MLHLVGPIGVTSGPSGPRLRESSSIGDLVRRQARCRFHPSSEVEERHQCGDLPDRSIVPAGGLQRRQIGRADEAGGLRQRAREPEQRPRAGVEIVLRPFRGERLVEVLIPGEATNCRRMETQSRRTADLPVHDRREHFPLEPAER